MDNKKVKNLYFLIQIFLKTLKIMSTNFNTFMNTINDILINYFCIFISY